MVANLSTTHEEWAADPSAPPAPESSTIVDVLVTAAETWPTGKAFVSGDITATYRDVLDLAAVAERQLAAHGVERGDRVAVWLPNTLDWLGWYFGTAQLGAVLVPMHTRWTAREALGVIEIARPAAVVLGSSGPGSPRPAELDALVSTIEGGSVGPALVDSSLNRRRAILDSGRPGALPARGASRPAETALIKFTSGSTSSPKGVRLAHHSIVRCAHNVGLRLGLEPSDVLFSAMPFFHVGGSVLSILTAFAHGAAVATLPQFDADQALAAVNEHACTVHIGMEIMFLKELTSPAFSRDVVRTLRTGWVAASSRAAAARIYEGTGVRLASVYGMTETSANSCMTSPTDPDELRLAWNGAPQPGLEVGIFDTESGKRLPDGVPGTIRVRGWALLQGYLGDADDTRTVDGDGWFETGDLGVIGDSGYLKFLGRRREMLKVGGENVACAEVEDTLNAHPGVAVAYLSAAPDDVYGELPVAFVEVARGQSVSEAELVEWCRQSLAGYKVPRRVAFVARDEWPLTGPEKVSRAALRAIATNLGAGASSRG